MKNDQDRGGQEQNIVSGEDAPVVQEPVAPTVPDTEDGGLPASDFTPPIQSRALEALRLLSDSYEYATAARRSCWDFAESIEGLHRRGMTDGDLRWLICCGYVQHGRETKGSHDQHREFQRDAALRFTKRSCFILTPQGKSFVGEVVSQQLDALRASPIPRPLTTKDRLDGSPALLTTASQRLWSTAVPKWDRELQELSLGNRIIKRYRVPAPNQETILSVFQEEHWPRTIDDPLAPDPDIDPKRRLHDTINSLNRNRKANLIQFHGNGSGTGVRWELIR